MKLYSVILIILTIKVLGHAHSISMNLNSCRYSCGAGCHNCTPCGYGYGVAEPCSGYQPPKCVPCVSGSNYSNIGCNIDQPCHQIQTGVFCPPYKIHAVDSIHGRHCICKNGYIENSVGTCVWSNPPSSHPVDPKTTTPTHVQSTTVISRPTSSSSERNFPTRHGHVSLPETESIPEGNQKHSNSLSAWEIAVIVIVGIISIPVCIVVAVIAQRRKQQDGATARSPSDDSLAQLTETEQEEGSDQPQSVQTVQQLPSPVIVRLTRKLNDSKPADLRSLLQNLCRTMKIDASMVLCARSDGSTTMGHQFFEILIQQDPVLSITSLCAAFKKEGRNDLIDVLREEAAREGIEISGDHLLPDNDTIQEESGGPYCEEEHDTSQEEPGGPYCEEEHAQSLQKDRSDREELVVNATPDAIPSDAS